MNFSLLRRFTPHHYEPGSFAPPRPSRFGPAAAMCCFILAGAITAAASTPAIVVLGDSLSAAYGMDDRLGWVNLLRARLDEKGYPHEVVNASVSGDTTRDALSRLDDTLRRHQPDIVLVELGGNDGLRAFQVGEIRANLASILETIRESGAKTVLAGMHMPPNYGPVYTEAFAAIYPELAQRHDAALIPFFMKNVATEPALMQDDGVHPNARAQPVLLDNVWPVLEPLLERRPDAGTASKGRATPRPGDVYRPASRLRTRSLRSRL